MSDLAPIRTIWVRALFVELPSKNGKEQHNVASFVTTLFMYFESKQAAGIAQLAAVTCILDLNFCLVFV